MLRPQIVRDQGPSVHASATLISSAVGGKLASEVLAPLNASGDREGCHLENGVVRTPKGFKDAFAKVKEGLARLRKRIQLELVDRYEFRSGAVAVRYRPASG